MNTYNANKSRFNSRTWNNTESSNIFWPFYEFTKQKREYHLLHTNYVRTLFGGAFDWQFGKSFKDRQINCMPLSNIYTASMDVFTHSTEIC